MFGKCLLCLLNWTVTACWKYPNSKIKIVAKKDDFKLTYRRCHLHWEMASKTMAQIPDLKMGFMNLCLTFGRKSLSQLLVLHVGNHVWPHNSNFAQWRMGPNDTLWKKPTSSPISKESRHQHPLWRRTRADCGHWRWCERHEQYIHQQLDPVCSWNWRFRQPSPMQQSTSSHVWHVFTTFRPKRTHSTRDNGLNQKLCWKRQK